MLTPKRKRNLWDIYNTDEYVNYPDDELQVASTVIDVNTGKVIAQLGSRHQSSNVSFGTNQAVETNRDWGSTMKPITDYAPALEHEELYFYCSNHYRCTLQFPSFLNTSLQLGPFLLR